MHEAGCRLCGRELSGRQRVWCSSSCKQRARKRRVLHDRGLVVSGAQRDAMRATLDAMEAAGWLEAVDSAVISAALGLAEAVDGDPQSPQLWREYRSVIEQLGRLRGGDNDSAEALLASLRDTPHTG